MTHFRLPDLGEGLKEAEIITWHVSPGDHVTADQPLVSVETDKAVVEVPSPQSGRIKTLFGKPKDIVQVGAVLVEFDDESEADSGAIVGKLEETAKDRPTTPTSIGGDKPELSQRQRVNASPAVRRLAERLGVDLSDVRPTGHSGEVTISDVEAAADLAEGQERIRGVRRAMAQRMADAGARVVPATVVDDADIEAWFGKVDIMPRLVRAITVGCRAAPSLNAWYDGERETRRIFESVDLGIAVDTADGLFVPVVRNVDHRDASELADEIQELKISVKSRTVSSEAMRGPTITLSNFGTMGGRYGALVVVPPQVAILGAGRVRPEVIAIDGTPTICHILPLSLTFDHRVVTGGEAARFLASVVEDLQRKK